ncbi:MAG: SDR family oxidoreductase [Spirochaetes bacterium]|nr:SDR family oxidoreductase [Spirochaetota bacterium]
MKVLLFGATGRTGKEIIKQAIEQNHEIRAFARKPEDIAYRQKNLDIFKGDILDYEKVFNAVKGMDAVISSLGIRILKKNTVISEGTRNIINAMEDNGVKRFICLSAVGVGESRAQQSRLGLLYNYFIIPHIIRNMFDDKEVQDKYILESSLDWTIVRAVILTSKKKTGNARSFKADDLTIGKKITRGDVADFMLGQIADRSNVRKAVSLSN